MRTLALLLPLLFVASCSRVAVQPAAPVAECKVGILVDHGQFKGDGFYWQVWFTNHSDMPHLVQEVYLGGGEWLVEVFEVGKGCAVRDHHTATDSPHGRLMFVYPAEVEGVDWSNGFAHLPENLDGSVKTSVGQMFNASYQLYGKWVDGVYIPDEPRRVKHVARGRVVREERKSGIHWTLSISSGRMTVSIGG